VFPFLRAAEESPPLPIPFFFSPSQGVLPKAFAILASQSFDVFFVFRLKDKWPPYFQLCRRGLSLSLDFPSVFHPLKPFFPAPPSLATQGLWAYGFHHPCCGKCSHLPPVIPPSSFCDRRFFSRPESPFPSFLLVGARKAVMTGRHLALFLDCCERGLISVRPSVPASRRDQVLTSSVLRRAFFRHPWMAASSFCTASYF